MVMVVFQMKSWPKWRSIRNTDASFSWHDLLERREAQFERVDTMVHFVLAALSTLLWRLSCHYSLWLPEYDRVAQRCSPNVIFRNTHA